MSKGKFALGALFGAVAGVIAGVLTAPKSGKETRAEKIPIKRSTKPRKKVKKSTKTRKSMSRRPSKRGAKQLMITASALVAQLRAQKKNLVKVRAKREKSSSRTLAVLTVCAGVNSGAFYCENDLFRVH